MVGFEKLHVYQDSLQFVDIIYMLTKSWPKEERFSLIDQLKRACLSIVLNIAEGSGRSKKEFGHYLDMSRGSCFECIAILTVAKRQKYIDQYNYEKNYLLLESLIKRLNSLKNSLLLTINHRPLTNN